MSLTNERLLAKYGLEDETDPLDIIKRQEAALINMRQRNINLQQQLDNYYQLNAAFETVRMERDEKDKQLATEYEKSNRLFESYSRAIQARDAAQECVDNLRRRNQCLEEDVRQLEDQIDGIDAGYDDMRRNDIL
jgi:chaperonin cofactor prefoldin